MIINTKPLQITSQDPFAEDLLGRSQYATVLTSIIGNTTDNFVLSINGPWGAGKTTFIEMWQKMLEAAGYSTIYFNAWKTDYAEDPFLAIIDGIVEQVPLDATTGEKKQVAKAVADAVLEMLKVVPCLGEMATVVGAMKKGIEDVRKGDTKIEDYRSSTRMIEEFKEKLGNYAKAAGNGKQLIIFVDELDRCRPNYAIEMLERIKHFFSIDNIVFVLSIDKSVILEEIKGFYNSSDICAENYLRRFVDLEFDLPTPSLKDFISAQYDEHDINAYISAYKAHLDKTYNGQNLNWNFKYIIESLFSSTQHSLRDIEKYFTRLDLIFRSFDPAKCEFELLTFLVYLYMFKPDIYTKIATQNYKQSDLLKDLESLFCSPELISNSDLSYHCTAVVAIVYSFYNFYAERVVGKELAAWQKDCKLTDYQWKLKHNQYLENVENEMFNRFTTHSPYQYFERIEMQESLLRLKDNALIEDVINNIKENSSITPLQLAVSCKISENNANQIIDALSRQRVICSVKAASGIEWKVNEDLAANLL